MRRQIKYIDVLNELSKAKTIQVDFHFRHKIWNKWSDACPKLIGVSHQLVLTTKDLLSKDGAYDDGYL